MSIELSYIFASYRKYHYPLPRLHLLNSSPLFLPIKVGVQISFQTSSLGYLRRFNPISIFQKIYNCFPPNPRFTHCLNLPSRIPHDTCRAPGDQIVVKRVEPQKSRSDELQGAKLTTSTEPVLGPIFLDHTIICDGAHTEYRRLRHRRVFCDFCCVLWEVAGFSVYYPSIVIHVEEILIFGRNTPIGALHRVIWVHIPNALAGLDRLVTGGRLVPSFSRLGNYVLYSKHPIVLVRSLLPILYTSANYQA